MKRPGSIPGLCQRVVLFFLTVIFASLSVSAQVLSTNTVTFGNVVEQTASLAKAVSLNNTSGTPLTINSIFASGDFATTSKCPINPQTLAAGASCQISITYTPTILGSESATLVVDDNASSSPQTALLTGTGVLPVSVAPSVENFGNQAINTTSTSRNVVVLNYLLVPLTISSIVPTGNFPTTTNCPLAPSTLAARGSCTISVAFAPTAFGASSGTLTITHNASNSPQTVQLSGSGVTPVNVSPTAFPFGAQSVNTNSNPKVFTLTNSQTSSLTVNSISISGPFSQTSNCPISPATLAANSNCTISVVFTPTAGGAASGVLTISDNASTSPQTVSVTGSGLLPVALNPSSRTFLTQHLTTTSAPQTFTLQNSQSVALTISSISTSGDFAETSNCPLSPSTLAAGSNCTISVTFTPTALGTRTGTLTVADSAAASPQTAALTGTGDLLGLVTIAITPSGPSMFTGVQKQLTATGTFSSGTTINVTNYANWSSDVPAFATVNSSGLLQALAPGEAIITASYGKASGYTPVKVSAPAITSISVTPAKQTQPVGAYQQFSAILKYSNGTTNDATGAVTWSSSSPNIATVNGSGLVTALSPGTTTIQASSGTSTGSTTFTVTQPACVAPPAGLIGWWTGDGNTVDLGGNHSATLPTGATYNTGQVAQSVVFPGNGSTMLVNSPVYSPTSGTLMFWFMSSGGGALTGGYAGGQNRAPGFIIDQFGNLNWEFANLFAQSLGQVNPNQWYHVALTYAVTNSQSAVNVYLNGTLVANAITDVNTAWNPQVVFGGYMGATQPSFVGSMDEIAIFNTALNAGQIRAVYNVFSAGMCKPTLQSIAVSPANPNLAPGISLPFDAVGTYSNKTTHDVTSSATWGTNPPGFATISATGVATGVASGSTIISAALGAVQGSTNLAVKPSLVSIQVTPQSPTLPVGGTQAFSATGTFSDASQQNLSSSVVWTSSSSAANISTSGVAVGASSGQTTITAAAGTVNGSAQLTVTSATLISISISPANPSIASGTTQQFTATGSFSDGSQQNLTSAVSWNASSSSVTSTISSSGLASGIGLGTVAVSATMGSVTGTANFTVTTAVLSAIQISPQSSSLTIGGSQQFSATGIYSDGTSANITASAKWTSSGSAVATMNATTLGLANSTGTGTTIVTAAYGGLSDSTTLTVQDQLVAIVVSPATASLATGQSRQFSATGTFLSGLTENLTATVNWNSSASSAVSIAPGGLGTSVAPGQSTITATFGSISGSATVNVGAPSVIGQWTTLPNLMPINPIHVALLANGEALVVAGSGACAPNVPGCPTSPPYGPTNGGGALLMNPFTGQVLDQFTVPFDMFCNGMVILQDGTVLIAGGNLQYNPFTGLSQAAIFDPSTNTFTDLPNMAHGRWYPTLLTLADGTIMTFSGLNETGATNPAVEFFTEGSNWSQQYIAPFTPDLYPRLHLLPNGMVFYSSATNKSKMFDPTTQTWNTNFASTNWGGVRLYGSSVMLQLTPANNYDPQVFIMGGGNPATNTTERIDLGAATPAWQYGPPMSQGRIEMNSVILPDGTVLALGGSLNNEDASTASLNADLYNPVTNTFSSAGANVYPRLYHSVAMLLPDATVWLAGSNPSQGTFEHHIEIYQPPYLFDADGTLATRPTIANAPSLISYGNTFTVTTPDAANVSSVVLMRNPTVTHAFGMDQRNVALSFTVGEGSLTVTAPPNGNILPPGYYMLFLLNNAGVPSVATFVQVLAASQGAGVLTKPTSSVAPVSSARTLNPSSELPQLKNTGTATRRATATTAAPHTPSATSTPKAALDLNGTWSGTFVSKEANGESFFMTVVLGEDSHGRLMGNSTLNSNCLKDAHLQVDIKGAEITLAGSNEVGDNITVRGTLDKSGSSLKGTYIVDGSASGKCEIESGAGTLTRH